MPSELIEKLYVPQRSWRELAKFSNKLALELVPYDCARRYEVLPISVLQTPERVLTLLSRKELSIEEMHELRFVTGAEIVVEQICCDDLIFAIESVYSETRRASTNEQPIPQLLSKLIEEAHEKNASDIHIEPESDVTIIRMRIDGILREQLSLLPESSEHLIRRIKVLSELDPFLTTKPLDGSFYFNFGKKEIGVRVSCLPTVSGEKVVLRLHAPESSKQILLSDLGMTAAQEMRVRAALAGNSGAVLLSGPTGSGKTTLLYAALDHLRDPHRNIVTIEDPVERKLRGISQTELTGDLTFSTLLRAALRQDPDVIMIGEIRDRDTAETSLTAAITGHLVLSTIHASSVFEIVTRLKQLLPDHDLIQRGINLLISQRLLPLNCRNCVEETRLPTIVCRYFGLHQETICKTANGCSLCDGSGVNGRAGVFEMLSITETIRSSILNSRPNEISRETLIDHGYLPYQFEIRERLINGEISPKTALRALGVPCEFIST